MSPDTIRHSTLYVYPQCGPPDNRVYLCMCMYVNSTASLDIYITNTICNIHLVTIWFQKENVLHQTWVYIILALQTCGTLIKHSLAMILPHAQHAIHKMNNYLDHCFDDFHCLYHTPGKYSNYSWFVMFFYFMGVLFIAL